MNCVPSSVIPFSALITIIVFEVGPEQRCGVEEHRPVQETLGSDPSTTAATTLDMCVWKVSWLNISLNLTFPNGNKIQRVLDLLYYCKQSIERVVSSMAGALNLVLPLPASSCGDQWPGTASAALHRNRGETHPNSSHVNQRPVSNVGGCSYVMK